MLSSWLHLGLHSDLDPQLDRRVRIANRLALGFAVGIVAVAIAFAAQGLVTPALACVLWALGCLLLPLAHGKGASVWARVALLLWAELPAAILGWYLGESARFQMGYLALVALPFVMFLPSERLATALTLSVPPILFFGLEFLFPYFPSPMRLDASVTLGIQVAINAAVFVSALLTYRSFRVSQHDLEERLYHSSRLAALGAMAGGVAHEINNPLGAIQNLAGQMKDLLSDSPLDMAMLNSRTQRIEATCDRIARIVRGLRSFSREGAADPFEPVKVSSVVDDTLAFCAERLGRSQVEMRVGSIAPELVVRARAVQLSQVLLNLIGNACDAIGGKPGAWVAIDAWKVDEFTVEIAVTDSGAGIPVEIAKKLFRPFFTTKSLGKGTGLGLNLSLEIVRAHGGSLTIDSSCRNTRFVCRLPISQPQSETKPSKELAA